MILHPQRGRTCPELPQTPFLVCVKSHAQTTQLALSHEVQFFRDRTLQTLVDIKTAPRMPSAPIFDKAPGQTSLQKVHPPSIYAKEASTQNSGEDAVLLKLDSASATTEEQPSKEVLSNPPTAPTPPSPATIFPFFRLPPELRDQIYIFASLTENVWIGRLPNYDWPRDVIRESTSIVRRISELYITAGHTRMCRQNDGHVAADQEVVSISKH